MALALCSKDAWRTSICVLGVPGTKSNHRLKSGLACNCDRPRLCRHTSIYKSQLISTLPSFSCVLFAGSWPMFLLSQDLPDVLGEQEQRAKERQKSYKGASQASSFKGPLGEKAKRQRLHIRLEMARCANSSRTLCICLH